MSEDWLRHERIYDEAFPSWYESKRNARDSHQFPWETVGCRFEIEAQEVILRVRAGAAKIERVRGQVKSTKREILDKRAGLPEDHKRATTRNKNQMWIWCWYPESQVGWNRVVTFWDQWQHWRDSATDCEDHRRARTRNRTSVWDDAQEYKTIAGRWEESEDGKPGGYKGAGEWAGKTCSTYNNHSIAHYEREQNAQEEEWRT